jgi:tRNA(fMet)-specific endonuclease VapC
LTNKRSLLDTNAAIALLNGDARIIQAIGDSDQLNIPIISVGELYYGAENSAQVAENYAKVRQITAKYKILNCDLETAQGYGRFLRQLRLKGRPIPQNDVWIAALALQHGLILMTRDAHFNYVDGLMVEGW